MNRVTKLVALAMASGTFCGTMSRPIPAAETLSPFDLTRGLVLSGTVVTMDDRHSVLEHGGVLVRDGLIAAVWEGDHAPAGTPLGAAIIDLGPSALIFPGMINLHNHPTYDVLRLWPAPSSDVQTALGRPHGTEPYANRYQWNRPRPGILV